MLHSFLEGDHDQFVERCLQLVHDEQNRIECPIGRGQGGREHDLPILEGHSRLGLRVELGTRSALDGAIESSEPQSARVDGRNQGVGLDLGDVVVDHVDACQLSLLKFEGRPPIIPT